MKLLLAGSYDDQTSDHDDDEPQDFSCTLCIMAYAAHCGRQSLQRIVSFQSTAPFPLFSLLYSLSKAGEARSRTSRLPITPYSDRDHAPNSDEPLPRRDPSPPICTSSAVSISMDLLNTHSSCSKCPREYEVTTNTQHTLLQE